MSTNVKQVYALRAFLGVFESSAYPGTVTLLSKSSLTLPQLWNSI